MSTAKKKPAAPAPPVSPVQAKPMASAEEVLFGDVHEVASEGAKDARRALNLVHELYAAYVSAEPNDDGALESEYVAIVQALFRLRQSMKRIKDKVSPETVALYRKVWSEDHGRGAPAESVEH